MRVTGVVAVVALVIVPACLKGSSGGAMGVPPAKVDLGYLTFGTDQGAVTGKQWLVGLNWATIYPKKTRFDVGLGYVGAVFENPFVETRVEAAPPSRDSKIRPPAPDPTIDLHGGYLEMAVRVASGSHWRTFLSGRGELSSVDGASSLGAAARITTEMWGGVMAGGKNAFAVGVFALGVWVEGSTRELGDRAIVTAASAGMSVRIPLLFAGGK
jgi:hypothetical protein